MKRDRRGRFLPAAVAARIGADPPLPGEINRPESVRRTRRGRTAALAREEKSAPEPKRWASPPSEAAAAPAVPGIPRGLSTGFCRLCHGKFSSRGLRNAFGKVPMVSEESEKQRRLDQVFFTDFQRLVGVPVQQDPSLPPFVCKKCHAQFYKCRSILKAFIQKVNVSPAGHPTPRGKNNLAQPSLPVASAGEGEAPCLDLITSSPQCLHQLVRWSHGHAENCPMAPSLQSVLSSKYCGIIRAVWGCEEGHNYIMSTDSDCSTLLVDSALAVQWELKKDSPQHVTGNGVASDSSGAAIPSLQPQHSAARAVAGQQPTDSRTALPASSAENLVPESRGLPSLQDPLQEDLLQATCPRSGSPGRPSEKLALSAASDERVKDAFSDLSEGESSNDDENHKAVQSSDDSFEPYPEKRVSNNRKVESKDANVEEPKTRKKPGPKPGWKKKIKCEREELPNIYKCPYQGCTAVYRGADGMKKHIKEHHEEVRERPCPHPGCNKVFMIDRYLQRHVKLIHTEVRNYICDECGQTFKQRKHLSVHQMRHSGAKPLQCEICGFQCRQRASLKYHMTKHKAEAELEFACDQCGKRFEKAHNLNVHMSMVHPLTQTQEKAKGGEPEPRALLDATEGQPIKVELSAPQEPT
ncbi:zinc finger protein 276 isoform X1 [Ahaetulla prasina]|uniref:zinc finger protein 276 isoform X1 n=2 Tax=Ahaetulla prasina TaxID=499056 RepID=UPI002648E0BD|nr:zinc finger protein 276 isoform X1 [Ahaetulla prasina]